MNTVNNSSADFEIGLVLAGAVSAGAYTAGVMDYLLETLEAWQAAKEKNENVPTHNIKIKVLTGASAGGMTAAITVVELLKKYNEQSTPPGDSESLIYKAWVKDIDIEQLLGTEDLKGSAPLKSLLDSSPIDKIANAIIDPRQIKPWQPIPYVSAELKVYLTLSNLRGLPYQFDLSGESGFPYGMTDHSDYQYVEISKSTTEADWLKLRNAAIATGAFPIGLASRLIKRDTNEYKERIHKDGRDVSGWLQLTDKENKPYQFVAVDGGTLNNEPIELARSVWEKITGEEKKLLVAGKSNELLHERKQSSKEKYALIMVDPFPNFAHIGPEPDESDTSMMSIIAPIIGALRAQSLFKMEELLRAGDEADSNLFMVAPIRYTDTGAKALHALASGFFSGFGGFLSEEFRKHDYQLGRRNCQRFLQKYFLIKEEDARKKGWKICDDYIVENKEAEKWYPIIPVIKTAPIGLEQGANNPWPTYSMHKAKQLKSALAVRVEAILNRTLPFGWIANKIVTVGIGIGILLIVLGEFVKTYADTATMPVLNGVKNSYILIFQIALILLLSGTLAVRLGIKTVRKKLVKSAYKIILKHLQKWGIQIAEE